LKNKVVLEVNEKNCSSRLDKALSTLPEIATRSRAENLIDSKLVFVNGKIAKSSYKIKNSDLIEIILPDQKPTDIIPLKLDLDILFEDQDLLVVHKPAGLVVHPAAGHEQDTLVNALVHHTANLSMKFGENRPGIVHRIDRDTSGLLVVAKNDFAHEKLSQDFKAKLIHRIYYALCIGKPKQNSGKIQSYLARHPTNRKRFASVLDKNKKIIVNPSKNVQGKWSVTHYTCLAQHPSGLSYLKLKLETGRTHQIRVHLSENGFPIAGDNLYGANKKIKNITSAEIRNLIQKIPRFALHAAELGFQHPRTNEAFFFRADWPADLLPIITEFGFHELK